LAIIDEILLIALVAAALWTVMARSLLRSALGLALSSAILSMIMFKLGSPVAAVFELSVCAGLISALFFCIITITEPLTPEKMREEAGARFGRFRYLPPIVLAVWFVLRLISFKIDIKLALPEAITDLRQVLWAHRQLDLIGQILILLCGVYGIVILLKEMRGKRD
jgi:NADH-quinone oxidoreductase subunit J